MTTTQDALARIYRDALGYCADNGLNTANRDADRNTLEASLTRLAELEKAAEGMEGALDELLEVAELRGDNCLPHPADDPKTWTARMQEAWDEAPEALAAYHKLKGEKE